MSKQNDFVDASGCHIILNCSTPARLSRAGAIAAAVVAGMPPWRRWLPAPGKNGETDPAPRQRVARSPHDAARPPPPGAPGRGVGAQAGRDAEIQGAREFALPRGRNPCGGRAECRDKGGLRPRPGRRPRRRPCGWPGCNRPAPGPSGRPVLWRARADRRRGRGRVATLIARSSVAMAAAAIARQKLRATQVGQRRGPGRAAAPGGGSRARHTVHGASGSVGGLSVGPASNAWRPDTQGPARSGHGKSRTAPVAACVRPAGSARAASPLQWRRALRRSRPRGQAPEAGRHDVAASRLRDGDRLAAAPTSSPAVAAGAPAARGGQDVRASAALGRRRPAPVATAGNQASTALVEIGRRPPVNARRRCE